eukprot:TRINITY_DN2967_c0_g2_i2.p2 TRINITY_DN2967_c0_g2~~TRINITY_DN2967_c0_g2_i2.p2  ORF type:complete len:205 (-),score=65.61 TRINITY_DN2967_c0_g2_i2:214-828(-)
MSLLDSVGRRPLFLVSSVVSTIGLVLVGLALMFAWPAAPTLAALCLFMAAFSVGVGPLTFVVAAEVFPLHVRGQAVSLVVFVNRFLSGAIALSYLSIAAAITPQGSFFLFAGISAISVAFYALCVPETKGKTLEQIAHDLAAEFRLQDPQWAFEQRGLRNVRAYPSGDRLVSNLSADHIVSALGPGDFTANGRLRRSSSAHSIY